MSATKALAITSLVALVTLTLLALTPAAVALLHEPAKGPLPADTDRLAALIKAVPLTVTISMLPFCPTTS